jgi:hypothetical protein
MHVKNLLVLLYCSIENKIEILKYAWVFFLKSKWWDEYCDWCYRLRNDWVDNLVSKEYKGNSAEISGKLYIYIYNFVTMNIYHIFWVYNLRLL